MQTRLIGLLLGGMVVASALSAQQGRWSQAKCDLKPGHYLVNSAVLYLKNASETRFDDQRKKDLNDAQRSLTQALTSGGQEKNPAAWYYLARYYVIENDAYGADSAFRKAEALRPECKDDIQFWRRNVLWVPTFNAGINALNAQQYDSAVAAFRRAAAVYDGEPQAYTVLATAYFNMPAETFLPQSVFRQSRPGLPDSLFQAAYDSAARAHYDSAAKYFRRGAEMATDPKFAQDKRDAMFNRANSFYAGLRYDSAAVAYAEYLKVAPNDAQALARLGDALQASGQKDSAMGVFATIIEHADSMEPASLLNAGVSIYNAAPPSPDTARLSADCRRGHGTARTPAQRRTITVQCDSVARQAQKDRDALAAKNFDLAAKAFEAGLAHNPNSRDGLFNLANAYLALRQPDKMLPVARRLAAIDPMSRNTVRLVAQAFALQKQNDSALHYVVLADSLLPIDVNVGRFSPEEQKASLNGVIANYHGQATAPLSLIFEFLDAKGTVVATQNVEVPAIQPDGSHAFEVQAIGTGIAAWRYRKG